ncbi:MAG: GGDEF domain-containing protein [Oscillospiraceae bacterium]|nr:GGDEF domain-containing protein [Oscillospiraceae bacterium]
MTEMKKKFDIFEMDIDESLKYKVAAFAGAFMHLTFLILFIIVKLYTMVVFNVFSVTLYVVMACLCEKESFMKHSFKWICLMYSEIFIHSIVSTGFLGMETCFFLYSMMTVPVVIYYLFLTCSSEVFKRWTVIFSLISIAILTALMLMDHFGSPLFTLMRLDLSRDQIDILRSINIVFNIFLLIGFSGLFSLEIHSLIKKLNETNDRLNFTATHDALTGLFNRHSLRDNLDALENSSEPFCLVMGDLDDFKKVNDTYGHDCGDIVLKTVAEIIMKNIPEKDIACRWGGEEILIIMHGSPDECLSVIKRIKSEINSLALEYDGRAVYISMTFGFAPGSLSDDIDELLTLVDKRLYKGKSSGKNVIIAE